MEKMTGGRLCTVDELFDIVKEKVREIVFFIWVFALKSFEGIENVRIQGALENLLENRRRRRSKLFTEAAANEYILFSRDEKD